MESWSTHILPKPDPARKRCGLKAPLHTRPPYLTQSLQCLPRGRTARLAGENSSRPGYQGGEAEPGAPTLSVTGRFSRRGPTSRSSSLTLPRNTDLTGGILDQSQPTGAASQPRVLGSPGAFRECPGLVPLWSTTYLQTMSHTHRKKPFTTVQSCQPGEPCILCQRRVGITVGKARERLRKERDRAERIDHPLR